MVPRVGVEPTHLAVSDFESDASANFAIWALQSNVKIILYFQDCEIKSKFLSEHNVGGDFLCDGVPVEDADEFDTERDSRSCAS